VGFFLGVMGSSFLATRRSDGMKTQERGTGAQKSALKLRALQWEFAPVYVSAKLAAVAYNPMRNQQRMTLHFSSAASGWLAA